MSKQKKKAGKTHKNIIILSDGTGNSPKKPQRTNVWRLYQALDLSTDYQFARYDDGVGTSQIKPLAAFQGAIGSGVKQNAKELYTFICQHYAPDDQIYMFGFSRGAYTVRLVVTIIATIGIVTNFSSEQDLKAKVDIVYREFRKLYLDHQRNACLRGIRRVLAAPGTLYAKTIRIGRQLNKLYLDPGERTFLTGIRRSLRILRKQVRSPNEPKSLNFIEKDVKVRFIGLWDCVMAHGLPFKPVTRALDRWFPLTPANGTLTPLVVKACHALSIDESRMSFAPFMWNEWEECKTHPRGGVPQDQSSCRLSEERVSQVWFAGVHTNLGGGYPDDSLSMLPLRWIMKQAELQGLEFQPDNFKEIHEDANPNGRIYNSRNGLGTLYRFQQRVLPHELRITGDLLAGAGQRYPKESHHRPKIHYSVFRRLKRKGSLYVPANIPAHYAIARDTDAIVPLANACDEDRINHLADRYDKDEEAGLIQYLKSHHLEDRAEAHARSFEQEHAASLAAEQRQAHYLLITSASLALLAAIYGSVCAIAGLDGAVTPGQAAVAAILLAALALYALLSERGCRWRIANTMGAIWYPTAGHDGDRAAKSETPRSAFVNAALSGASTGLRLVFWLLDNQATLPIAAGVVAYVAWRWFA